jgi:hypothetical protein
LEKEIMNKEDVLRKIAKCMALANDARGDAATAAVALAQAQKLMARHGVTEQELGAYGFTQETIKTAIQCGKVVPVVLNAVVSLMQRAFGVKAVMGRGIRVSDYNWDITYWGPEHRVMLASYAHTIVQRTVDRAWATYIRENPHRKGAHGARAGFYLGWIAEVRQTIEDFGWSEEDEAGTKQAQLNHYGKELGVAKASKQGVRQREIDAGREAGEGFQLHRPINGSERLKIGN